MVNNSYQKIISMSLEKYIWFFIVGTLLLPVSSIVMLMLKINYILKVERDESTHRWISMDPSISLFFIILSLVIVILWGFIKMNLNHQNESVSIFLHSLFKVLLMINIFSLILSILNLLYFYRNMSVRGFEFLFLFFSLSDFAWGLYITTFLMILVRSFSKKYSIKTLFVLKNIGMVILVINAITNIIRIVGNFINLFNDDVFFYNSLEEIILILITIALSIIWILWINNFVFNLIYFNNNEEVLSLEPEESSIFTDNQRRLNNSLRKFGIIAIATGAMILRLVFIIYQFVQLFKHQGASLNQDTVIFVFSLLRNPCMISIFIEVIIYIWIAILVLYCSKKHILTPLITLFILYWFTFIQSTILYIYIRIRYIDYSLFAIEYNFLAIQFIQLLAFIVFIGILIWNYFELIKLKIVIIISTGFVIISIVNLIFSVIIQKNPHFYMSQNLTSLTETNMSITVSVILNTIIILFWIIFTIFYCLELYQDDEIDSECENS